MEYAQVAANKMRIKSFQIFNSGRTAMNQILSHSQSTIPMATVATV
jgi:hypothetical protein